MVPAFAAPAHAARNYVFTKVADSATDGFNRNTLSGACPSINNEGDIAFKSERGGVDGIFRVNADGTSVTKIAEVGTQVGTAQIDVLGNASPSMNNLGQVSFEALLSDNSQVILRGDGTTLTTIASTDAGFNSFEEETSINNLGEVAFYGVLDSGARGLFSGSDGLTFTTHYTNAGDVTVDGDTATFDAAPTLRPSINDDGDIAFRDAIQGTFDADVYRGQEGVFTTISVSDPPVADTPPLLNEGGTAIWQTTFPDPESGLAARAIVTSNGGPATRVVDSTGAFNVFDSYALNNNGAVAFSALLDDDELGIPSIFDGPSPKKNKVIGPGDKLDGGIVAGLNFCEEGLNDSGQLAFVAVIEDRGSDEPRAAVFRATLRR
jgi:hypothetical protein